MKYTGTLEAKTGEIIPIVEKIALHSKYNPIKEAENFANQFFSEESDFYIILGLAGGFHIDALLKKNESIKIIAYEERNEDLQYLMQLKEVKKLSNRIIFATKENIEEEIIKNYKPTIHGNLTIATLRAWENLFKEEHKNAVEKIQSAVKIISADFSVQSHFGKIWQRNIFLNLKEIKSQKIDISNKKIAAIIAAGSSFNETYKKLQENRENYFVIATDTAYSSLLKRKIKVDAVVSIDGQNISHSHFMNTENCNDTFFVFDLCANNDAVKKVQSLGGKIIFAQTGHPLSQYAANYSPKTMMQLTSGSGTVTITAANFAMKLGFSKLEFFGADFSYKNGLPYTKGTYLDEIYRSDENKLENSETRFSRLMFRTELKSIDDKTFTTEILESYSKSLNVFMESFGYKKIFDSDTKIFHKDDLKTENINMQIFPFDFEGFKKFYFESLKSNYQNVGSPEYSTLLPLQAWFKKSGESTFLAYKKTLGYSEKL